MRSRMFALTTATLLVGAGLLWAQTPASPETTQEPATAMSGHTMSGTMMGEPAEGGSMMDDCKAMMGKRQALMDDMKAMDAKLDALVKAMNEARGSGKVDATAAVVTELVAQRQAMRQAMESMQPMLMQHMMKHMKTGMMQGMSESISGCPMMGNEEPAAAGHSHDH